MAKKAPAPTQVSTTKMPILGRILTDPSREFQEALLQELCRMEQSKREAQRLPEHTTRIELEEHINRTLNALYLAERIKVGRTINNKYILTQQTTQQ